jgi:cardiolipin synthase C
MVNELHLCTITQVYRTRLTKPGINRSAIFAIAIAILGGCASVPLDEPKTYSEVMTNTADTPLGLDVARWLQAHEGLSGFYPLSQGMDALGVRLQLAERAEKSIDLQYFLLKDDTAGAVVIKALLKAADRGVRVRCLLDDIFTKAPDRSLLLLDQHENIEVRVFNPISRKGLFGLNFLTSFKRANRRMHNKSFTVDNQATVVGGRNIADEYFQLKDDSVFADFEVLAVGPITNEISESFDRYWNHPLAVPIEHFVANKNNEELATVRAQVAEEMERIYDTVYQQTLESQLLQDLIAERETFIPADARVLSDSPDKLINEISDEHMELANDLREVLLSAEEEVILITPYYVPRKRGVELLRNQTERGIRVVIVTNSLASNNHVPVHSGYARYRKDVIRAGVELFEVRANAGRDLSKSDSDPESLTLHTKVFLFDRRYIFVGSLNLDPRSVEINAEMGLLIDSPEFAGRMAVAIEEDLAIAAYRVIINERGKLEWHATIDGEEVIATKEPLTSWWRRFNAWFMKIVPASQL